MKKFLIISCLFVSLFSAYHTSAVPTFYTPWTPLFSGVDLATGTNFSGGNPIFAHALRIDLTNPGVRLLPSPPNTNNPAYETYGLSVSNFVKKHQLQVAINANDWNGDPLAEGAGATVNGLMISKGVTVSPQNVNYAMASLLISTSNVPSIVLTNTPPGTNTAGIYTALTGFYPLVWNGVNMCLGGVTTGYDGTDGQLHEKQPRTSIGYSQDKRYLYLVCIDGRQLPFSNGATDEETADLLILFGVYQGISLDGGGSATMVKSDGFGNPVELNRSTYSLGNGRERVVGSHFGVYALPLPGFINDVVVAPLDTTANITWTTISNSTSQVAYGTTTNLGTFSTLDSTLVTNHSVNLSGLISDTTYYYRVISVFNGSNFTATGSFTTSDFATTITTPVFGLTNAWKWNTNNLSSTNWTAAAYNDSAWNGPGLGALCVENGNNVFIPRNTFLPPTFGAPVNGVPIFQTYYFRTTFNYSNNPAVTTLTFSNYIDDGAVFYLNGVEIQRVRMAAAPTVIANNSVATGSPAGGDATSADAFAISGNLITNLITGTNVLAVEVHQAASPGNADMVFASALFASITTATLPTVVITTPADNQSLAEGTSVTINTAVTGVSLTNVSFYRDGGVLIGHDATGPFSAVSSNLTLGAHTLTAVVYDYLGQTATSAVVNITVATLGLQVGLAGTGTNGFAAWPTVVEGWTTANLPGSNGALNTGPEVDAALQTVTAVVVSGALTEDFFLPPTAFGQFRWNSAGLFIQSRPTGTMLNLLLATLRNNTGTNVGSLDVSYDFGEASGFESEEVPGLRVFYSLTGAANTWQPVPALTTATPGALTATLNVTNWPAGSSMYLLWGDDNADSSEGSYTIDNFAIRNVLPPAPPSLPTLQISQSGGGAMTVNWPGAGYTLQQTSELLGTNTPWADVPGPVTTSPYSTNHPPGSRFFRLRP